MHRKRKIFPGLRWKLTLSYILVTVAALIVVEIIAIGVVVVFVLNSDLVPREASRVMFSAASDLYPYLESEPPDYAALNNWLAMAAVNGISVNNDQSGSTRFLPGQIPSGDIEKRLMVLDAELRLLASIPTVAPSALDEPIYEVPSSEFSLLFISALEGEDDPDRLYAMTAEKAMIIVAPIRNPQGQTLGILAFTGAMLSSDQNLGSLFSAIGISLIVFTLAAGAVGTVFGFFTARGLSRRLSTVTQAADSWSRGDFSAFIHDRSTDELGQMAHHLNRMAEQLQNLLHTRQELATLEERNRLARDLHDSVKQQVFATVMQVGAARALLDQDPQAAGIHMMEAEKLSRQAQSELTALIRELRPAALLGRGLAEALKDHVDDWSRQNNIPVDFRVQVKRPLSLEIEVVLFRVAQEALANVARHSSATRVEIDLIWKNEELALTVKDNGIGFDVDAAEDNGGVGLRSMQERLESVGGELKVESTPAPENRGTQIVASCKTTSGVNP